MTCANGTPITTKKERDYKERVGINIDACDWCDLTYPSLAKERFYSIVVVGDKNDLVLHKICGDCYDRLNEVHQ